MTHFDIAAGASAADIQALIDTAEAGTELRLAAGVYTFETTVVIDRSDITVLGAGSGDTVITMAIGAIGEAAFQIGHALYDTQVRAETTLAQDASQGGTQLVLAAGHGVQVGDTLGIETANTDAFFDAIGDTLWRKDMPLRTMLAQVVAVDGDTVTLSRETVFDHAAALTTVRVQDMVENVTLSGFTFDSGLGVADPSLFSNTVYDAKRSSAIVVAGAQDSTLSDIEILNPASHGLTLDDSIGITVTGLEVSGAHNKGSGGNGYAVWLRNVVDSDLTDLTLMDTRHAVVFGSWNTAIGNLLHVRDTNRDINFHGGRDTGNTVIVDRSVRTEAEADYMASNLFFNEGERYGAPTDIAANTVTFGEVAATVRQDLVFATENGSMIITRGAADTVYLNTGNDSADLGSGHDTVHGMGGLDVIDGGSGVDTFVTERALADLNITRDGDSVVLWDMLSSTTLTSVETVIFADGTLDIDTLDEQLAVTSVIGEVADGQYADLPLIQGSDGWERAQIPGSIRMGEALEAANYSGTEAITVIGSGLNNHVMTGAGSDRIEGRGGNDRLLGRGGDDVMLGGDGDDMLFGMTGDDTLTGGAGQDVLDGGDGADTFVIDGDGDVAVDFTLAEGDTLIFNSAGPEANVALADWLDGGSAEGTGLGISEVLFDDAEALRIAWGSEAIMLLGLGLDDFA
ncbi:calcium-binding protein [Tropicibacter naphthalenivorans]|uniref:Hemolysin, chromosomal n=1 Tax=Tropicibacter naphthalenivorans TaxID=441103 RepID=A0A0P1GF32_9RHOB|nr:calcium-binding protein [Tropicibacter naphthalenivorans]CUH80082.1 Hemolysin, chromosomal [Tropicibacter naphthalenivorans]SMC84452.1 hypothetical protein SAMN04488093_10571 [Tropicibacter naphthalenivorans]